MASDGSEGSVSVVLGRFEALVARGLLQVLREGESFRVVGSDLDGAALERIVARKAPEVAILDEAAVAGPSVLERVRAIRPTIGIVVFAHRPTRPYRARVYAAGAACLPKDVCAAEILATIRLVAEGKHPAEVAALTLREAEVLECIQAGQTRTEIAHTLQIGVETVRTHTASVRHKLGVRHKRELIGLPINGQSNAQLR
ncbi:MAG: response regulator transcription factor [Solirubrobacteraceae bacterium]